MSTENVSRSKRWPFLTLVLLMLALMGGVLLTASPASAQTGLISGVVTDPSGGLPPAGTTINLITPAGEAYGQATADPATGEFSLGPVANGNYILQAKPPSSSPYTPSLPQSVLIMGSSVNLGTVALTNPAITGTVFAPDGVTPVLARINVYRADMLVQTSLSVGGAIEVGGLPAGNYTIQAERQTTDPFWKSPQAAVTINDGVSQTVDLTLAPANVAGLITDPQGVPLPDAIVHVVGATNNLYRRDLTSPGGFFAVGDLPPDTYILVAEPPYYAANGLVESEAQTFTVPPAFTDLGTIPLRDAPKILKGVVETNTGSPVENARVVANRLDYPGQEQTLTDSDGEYTMRLSGGLWAVTVEKTDLSDPSAWLYLDPPKLVFFNYDLDPDLKTLNFEVLTADAEVVGVIEMPDGGAPPFTTTVALRNNEGNGIGVTIDPTDGSFAIRVPNGNYRLFVNPEDPQYAGPPPEFIFVPANGTLDVGTLTLIEKDAVISGVVTDEMGMGVGDVQIVAWTRDYQGGQTRTNPDGSYALPVTPGNWQVKPDVPPTLPYIYDGEPTAVSIESMQTMTGTDFVLTSAPNRVVGQLVSPDGGPVLAQGTASATDDGGTVNNAPILAGEFTLYLPDGTFDIRSNLAPGSEWLPGPPQNVMVAGGETLSLTVSLMPQDATIAGALWDPRQEVVPTGVNGSVMADNYWAWVGAEIEPANGTYALGVSAGLWHMIYTVDLASGYVPLNHGLTVPVESGQTLGVPLPVAERDSVLSGVVLRPDGSPLAGAVVIADGIGSEVNQVVLRTISRDDGSFSLAVPYGMYKLHASHRNDMNWLNPVLQTVITPPDGMIDGITLQFRDPDVTLTGVATLANNPDANGRVTIWAYTDEGAATSTTALLGETYTLNLLSGLRWHVGAVFETPNSYFATRETLFMAGNETLDLSLEGPFAKPGPISVSFDASESQAVRLADGTEIFVPAGAMPTTGTVTLYVTPIATFPHQNYARLYNYGYAIVALDESGRPITEKFNQNVIISFSYSEEELADLSLNENNLKPAYFSTTTQSWTVPDGYVVNTANDRITMLIDHFTDFSLFSSGSYEVFLPIMQR